RRKAEAGVELFAQAAEVFFGDGGDGALESRDDGVKLALLLRLDPLDGFGHLVGARAAREAAQRGGEQVGGGAQDAARPAERAGDRRLDRLDRRFAADRLYRPADGFGPAQVYERRAPFARAQGVAREVAEMVRAAREVDGA